jgi:hypothetical protein
LRILQLGTHTTLVPTHGGKLRSHHTARVLEEHGCDVRRIAVAWKVDSDLDDPREPIIDISLSFLYGSLAFNSYRPVFGYISDYLSAQAVLTTAPLLQEFDRHYKAADPELIVLEHPWLWPLVERFDAVRDGQVP